MTANEVDEENKVATPTEDNDWITRLSNTVDKKMHNFFSKVGLWVALRPKLTIFLTFLIVIITGAGFMNYTTEQRAFKLWVPQDAIAQVHNDYVIDTYGNGNRIVSVYAEPQYTDNVLTKSGLLGMYDLYQYILSIEATVTDPEIDAKIRARYNDTYTFSNICAKQGNACFKSSILDLFNYNQTLIQSFSNDDEILTYINDLDTLLLETGFETEINTLLGGITYDNLNNIKSAKIAQFLFFIEPNVELTSANDDKDPPGEAWEYQLSTSLLKVGQYSDSSQGIISVYGYNIHALFKAFGDAIEGDLGLLSSGYILLILYVLWMLGPNNKVHRKIGLALASVLSVMLSISACYGTSSALGFFFGPVHNVLPFLLLGLGIDDTFIIVNAYHNELEKDPEHQKTDIPTKISNALGHAGVSITVTSISDIAAFLIGATTILPALSSFCIYASIGIFFDFYFKLLFL